MKVIHPYVMRIRTERMVINTVNVHKDTFVSELSGLSAKAIDKWCESMPEAIKNKWKIDSLVTKLKAIGSLTKLASNGSHRGAMIAPKPNSDVVNELVAELNAEIDTLITA